MNLPRVFYRSVGEGYICKDRWLKGVCVTTVTAPGSDQCAEPCTQSQRALMGSLLHVLQLPVSWGVHETVPTSNSSVGTSPVGTPGLRMEAEEEELLIEYNS